MGLNYILQIHLISLLIMFSCSSASQDKDENHYVQDACSVTQYRDLCIHSLAPFSSSAKNNPSRWARAGVSVTIGQAKRVARYLTTIRRNKKAKLARGKNGVALLDCIVCFQDTLDNLHKSLNVLRKLDIGQFGSQLDDVATWVSAALTDEDTCLDGFDELKEKRARFLLNRVSNVTYMTSNALALVNKLATTGPKCLLH